MTAIKLLLEVVAKPANNRYLTYVKECLEHKITIDQSVMRSFLPWLREFAPYSQVYKLNWDQISVQAYQVDSLKAVLEEIETKFLAGVVIQSSYAECLYYPQSDSKSIYDTLTMASIPAWADKLELKLTYVLAPPSFKIEIPAAIFEPLPKEEPSEESPEYISDIPEVSNPPEPLPPDHPGFRHL